MERDTRRDKGQWKGCHTFRDIICDGDTSKTRNGCLEMGQTYYYYYEIDGSTETFDTSMPSTTACPSLPGQTVNTLTVPSQHTLRQRSASLSSMRITDYQAMDPQAKFITPRPAPPDSPEAAALPKRSAPGFIRHATSSRSLSPAPAWKRLFSHKSRDDERGRSWDRDDQSVHSVSTFDDNRSAASSRSRNRSISPESLRRFLSDDVPTRPGSNLSERPALVIPEDIVEENEDDDNFATSTESESQTYTTSLAPPPFQRSISSETSPLTTKNLSSLTLSTVRPTTKPKPDQQAGDISPAGGAPTLEAPSQAPGSNLTSATSSALASPLSASTPNDELLTFYDDSNDDDDILSGNELDVVPIHAVPAPQSQFAGYSLPRPNESKVKPRPTPRNLDPQVVASGDPGTLPSVGSSFLTTPIDTGVDDFASELGWMVGAIGSKN